ncbi:bifunctional phosphoglucose/phosphomannose isomerase [Phaeocystidibacter luteus]|uniref:Bifunctional phosphoglucose/phosphomannose isomerase n=1 Tax=Phaeocystidibacter luteus TaxID=911197 RepID=A0A6N6REY6_9FLAO|nr:bifunctional phosphoglucose/phosphomannose isomerase [Phaeocystidibacter luteus]KAB2808736.1 bifunctional phosphoglucose/phosphomannose isomerase [Phaeocystidibacter luteus]
MKDLIADFPKHLKDALSIANEAQLRSQGMRPANVLITGMGGSGIGGSIVTELCAPTARIPIAVNKGYSVPHWVGTETLIIASSYSGNTEETLEAALTGLEYGAMLAAITSGGQLKKLCEERGLNHIIIPGGNPPRSMFGYSFVQLFRLLQNYGVQTPDWETEIANAADYLLENQQQISDDAKALAEKLQDKTLAIYATNGLAGVATRWRQQVNENSKVVGWDAAVPEMNHNELVGWAGGSDDHGAIFLRSETEHKRNGVRAEKNAELLKKQTPHVYSVTAKGKTDIERALYMIHFGDYVSLHLAELKGADMMDIRVIEDLKSHLQNIPQ